MHRQKFDFGAVAVGVAPSVTLMLVLFSTNPVVAQSSNPNHVVVPTIKVSPFANLKSVPSPAKLPEVLVVRPRTDVPVATPVPPVIPK